VAPDFAVPEVRGGTVSLDELLGRGLPVLLTFVGRGCVPSEELAPDLARWQRTLSDRLTIALISWGGPEHNQYESERLGIDDIGLQSLDGELLLAYRIRGTPSGVLISTDGRVMANIAEGGPGIESLIRLTLRRTARGSSDGALGQPAAASRSPAGA
jgi:hypothetical protein